LILSRFWYVVLGFVVGACVFLLYIAAALFNRTGQRALSESLAADSSAVGWYLKDDARNRSAALIPLALDPDVRAGLTKASGEVKPARENAEKTRVALKRLADPLDEDVRFDALWAVDANGRVIATVGDLFAAGEDWELGGFPVVADALHGWIRDDTWVWKGRILRVVARPVEQEVNAEPVGALVGVRAVDDKFAQSVTRRTGTAIGFYADNARVASWAPEGFDRANLDVITQDLLALSNNKDYIEKGRSEPRVIHAHLGVVYARLPGEAWDLGAGFAVGRLASAVDSPWQFLEMSDDSDKATVPVFVLVPIVLLFSVLGLLFSFLEHTRPIAVFRAEVGALAAGKVDTVAPSKQTGVFRKIAQDLNDGIEKVVVKGGGARRAADLQQVLGPIPAQPKMSAFSVPGRAGPAEGGAKSSPATPASATPAPKAKPELPRPKPELPKPKPHESTLVAEVGAPAPDTTKAELLSAVASSEPVAMESAPRAETPPAPKVRVPAPHETTMASPSPAKDEGTDELAEWRHVYEEFLAVKRECGEPTANLAFEKFKGTLERNKAALVQRHGAVRVKFTVYVKDGKAALKASPVK
jgi:hypothetical protein